MMPAWRCSVIFTGISQALWPSSCPAARSSSHFSNFFSSCSFQWELVSTQAVYVMMERGCPGPSMLPVPVGVPGTGPVKRPNRDSKLNPTERLSKPTRPDKEILMPCVLRQPWHLLIVVALAENTFPYCRMVTLEAVSTMLLVCFSASLSNCLCR